MTDARDSALDVALLKRACNAWVGGNVTEEYVSRQELLSEGERLGASTAEVNDALEILCSRGLLRGDSVNSRSATYFTATHRGQKAYLQRRDGRYTEMYERVANEVAKRDNMIRNWDIAQSLEMPHGLVNHFLFEMCERGDATRDGGSAGGRGGLRFYVTATAQLRRRLRAT